MSENTSEKFSRRKLFGKVASTVRNAALGVSAFSIASNVRPYPDNSDKAKLPVTDKRLSVLDTFASVIEQSPGELALQDLYDRIRKNARWSEFGEEGTLYHDIFYQMVRQMNNKAVPALSFDTSDQSPGKLPQEIHSKIKALSIKGDDPTECLLIAEVVTKLGEDRKVDPYKYPQSQVSTAITPEEDDVYNHLGMIFIDRSNGLRMYKLDFPKNSVPWGLTMQSFPADRPKEIETALQRINDPNQLKMFLLTFTWYENKGSLSTTDLISLQKMLSQELSHNSNRFDLLVHALPVGESPAVTPTPVPSPTPGPNPNMFRAEYNNGLRVRKILRANTSV